MAKAFLLSEQLIKLILAAAGIFIIVMVLYKVLSPPSNPLDETAESYFNTLEKQISNADASGKSEFVFWKPDTSANFYLVYFGDKVVVEKNKKVFLLSANPSNTICVCYLESQESKKGICSYCKDLSRPAILQNSQKNQTRWALKTSNKPIKIFKNKNYIFQQ